MNEAHDAMKPVVRGPGHKPLRSRRRPPRPPQATNLEGISAKNEPKKRNIGVGNVNVDSMTMYSLISCSYLCLLCVATGCFLLGGYLDA